MNESTTVDLTKLDIEHLIDNPTEYGYEWEWGSLEAKGSVVTKGRGAPIVKFNNLPVAIDKLGEDFFLKMADGGSIRVQCQTLRDELKDNIRLRSDERAMQRWVWEKLLGQKARRRTVVSKPVFMALDGNGYDTAVEAKAASLAHLVDQGMTADEAKIILSKMAG